jgi:hypothetical protein
LMYKFIDLTGQVFGERVVLELSHQAPISGNYYWKVRCSCGREDVVLGTQIKKGTRCLECSGRINGRKGLDSQATNLPCYFIQCGAFIKIGSSKDPHRRLKDMASNNPYHLTLLKIDLIHGEKHWHDKLKPAQFRGEWYHYSDVCEIVDIS